jgi:hypothetical protein
MLNFVVWNKSNAGQVSFYRSQNELIAVFRAGDAPHQNNIELGKHGRHRSNIWHYPRVTDQVDSTTQALDHLRKNDDVSIWARLAAKARQERFVS